MKRLIGLGILLLLISLSGNVVANCRTEIGYVGPNQVGSILLFSARGGGPWHPILKSDFWAVSGPSDSVAVKQFAVRFTPEMQAIVDNWDWNSREGTPHVLRVVADGVMDGHKYWLSIREILWNDDDLKDALSRYPDARYGTCRSYFSRE